MQERSGGNMSRTITLSDFAVITMSSALLNGCVEETLNSSDVEWSRLTCAMQPRSLWRASLQPQQRQSHRQSFACSQSISSQLFHANRHGEVGFGCGSARRWPRCVPKCLSPCSVPFPCFCTRRCAREGTISDVTQCHDRRTMST